MKKLKYILSVFAIAGLMSACEDDLEHYTVSGLTPSELSVDVTTAVLDIDKISEKVLTLTWNSSTLAVGGGAEALTIPKGGNLTLQVSKTEDFANYEAVEGVEKAEFTHGQLQTLANKLGLEPKIATTIYFRIASNLSTNSETLYSNIVKVSVTPYPAPAYLYLFDQDKTSGDTIALLFSKEDNNIYNGFVGAKSWLNFTSVDNKGIAYGTSGKNEWKFGKITTDWDDDKKLHLWSPEPAGCYYFLEDNVAMEMSYTYISALTVSGDAEADLTFDRESVSWMGSITTTADNQEIIISGDATLYNSTTGADAGEKTNFYFGGTDGTLSVESAESKIIVPSAGTYVLKLDLKYTSTKRIWTYEFLTGEIDMHKDLSNTSILVVGGDMGWYDNWEPSEETPGVKFTKTADYEYEAKFTGVGLTQGFGFRTTAPISDFLGSSAFTTVSDNLDVSGSNPAATVAGVYTLTVKAVCNDDGTITYSLTAEKTGDLPRADLSNVKFAIAGGFNDWSTTANAVSPTGPDENFVYTYTFSDIVIDNTNFKFTDKSTWLGGTIDNLSTDGGNISLSNGTYDIVFKATANADGTVSYSATATLL